MKRFWCWFWRHNWRVLPDWVSQEKSTMRVCGRCQLVQMKHVGKQKKDDWWEDIGRQVI